MMNQKQRMLAGLPYKAWLDGLKEERLECKEKIYEFNTLPPKESERIPELLKKFSEKQEKMCTLRLLFTVIMAGILKWEKISSQIII